MEQNSTKLNKKTKKPIINHGGKREGSGRPPNSKQQLTIVGLLQELKERSGGQPYEAMLVDDFLEARNRNDTQLTLKYHNLILNKVMNTLVKAEITDSEDNIEAKKLAFAEALAKLTGIEKE